MAKNKNLFCNIEFSGVKIQLMTNPFRFSYSAEVTIEVKKDNVWQALTQLENYHLWNPFTPKVTTTWKIGEPVFLTVQMRNGKPSISQKEFITKLDPKKEFAWGMRWSIFLKAERVQKLHETTDDKTIYYTQDIIEGILSPLVHLIYGRHIESGFSRMALALKKYLEK